MLQTRVRTAGLTESWEVEPAHIPFNFEFDPHLEKGAILTLPDATRDEQIAQAIQLEPAPAAAGEASSYLSLGGEWTLRNPPRIAVALPLPCDLAHAISLEFEGIEDRFPGGHLIVSGQGLPRHESAPGVRRFELQTEPALAVRLDRGAGPAPDEDLARSPTSTPAGPIRPSARSGRADARPTGFLSRSCGGKKRASSVPFLSLTPRSATSYAEKQAKEHRNMGTERADDLQAFRSFIDRTACQWDRPDAG